jgi:hypothetical protein
MLRNIKSLKPLPMTNDDLNELALFVPTYLVLLMSDRASKISVDHKYQPIHREHQSVCSIRFNVAY